MPTLSSSLVKHQVASVEDVADALTRQAQYGGDLVTNLLELRSADEERLAALLAEAHGLSPAPVGELPRTEDRVRRLVPAELATRYGLYPLDERAGTLTVAVSEPLPGEVEGDMSFALGVAITQQVALPVRVRQAIARDYGVALEARAERLLARLAGRPDPNPSLPPPLATEDALGQRPATLSPPGTFSGTAAAPIEAAPAAPIEAAPAAPIEAAPAAPIEAAPAAPGTPEAMPELETAPESLAPARAESEPAPEPQIPRAPALPVLASLARREAYRARRPRRLGPYTAAMAEQDLLEAATRDDVLRAFFDFAAQFFDYAALFAVHGDLAEGRDAHGPGASRTKLLSIGVPLDLPSALASAREAPSHLLVRLGAEGIDGALAKDLERRPGRRVLLLPVRVRARAVLILFGDHGDSDVVLDTIGDVLSLAPLVSAAVERLIVQRKRPRSTTALPAAPPPRARSILPSAEERAQALVSALESPPLRSRTPFPALSSAARPEREPVAARERLASPPPPLVEPASVLPPVAPVAPVAPAPSAPPPPVESAPSAPPRPAPSSVPPRSERSSPARPPHPAHSAPPRSFADQYVPGPDTRREPESAPENLAAYDPRREPESASSPSPAPTTLFEPLPAPSFAPLDPFGSAPGQEVKSRARPVVPDLLPAQSSEGQAPASIAEALYRSQPAHETPSPPLPSPSSLPRVEAHDPRPSHAAQRLELVPEIDSASHTESAHAGFDGDDALAIHLTDADVDEAWDYGLEEPLPSRTEVHSARPLAPPGDSTELKLPSVIVDLTNDCRALLGQLLAGDDSASDRLVEIGTAAVTVLLNSFPGPLQHPSLRPGAEPTRASECGPVLRTLLRLGTKSVPFLVVRTNDGDPTVRRWAVHLLGELPTRESAHAIARRFFDTDDGVRRGALAAARLILQHPELAADLVSEFSELSEDRSKGTGMRLAAIEALADLRHPLGVPGLIRVLTESSPEVVESARWALCVLTRQDFETHAAAWTEWWRSHGSRHRIEWLIDALTHESQDIRRAAGEELKIVTREYFGYYDDLPARERERAQVRYREWWETRGKARFH